MGLKLLGNRKRGGLEEERKEHEKWIKAKQRKMLNCVRATLNFGKRTGTDADICDEVFI